MKKHLNNFCLILLTILFMNSVPMQASQPNGGKGKLWSVRIAESFLARNPKLVVYDPSETTQRWHYEHGLMLETLKKMFMYTGEDKYFDYIKQNIDGLVEENGNIKTYRVDEFNIDQITPGKAVLYLYQVTGENKYKIAIDTLMKQLRKHPRTKSNGFWHKQIYPYQMWLDGLYMGQPFYAEYSKIFSKPENFDDIIHQFSLMYEKAKDPKTGLLYHAWDESKQQKWANAETGLSPHFWGRAIGWYVMALVDVLDFFPKDHPKRGVLITQLQEICSVLIKYRDPQKDVWYQIVDLPKREGNYTEASASSMYAYAFAKGANNGYLAPEYYEHAQTSFEGVLKEFVTIDEEGLVNLNNVCSVAGLGGNPYRDGSFEYYMSEKKRTNDFKGYGPFLLAAIELERGQKEIGAGVNIILDHYYNNETRKNRVTGVEEEYHYILSDTSMAGYSDFGKVFEKYGAKITELRTAPTLQNLAECSVYIISDPDTPAETPNPNYIVEKDIEALVEWVKNGGVLLLFANDKGNSEFEHLNNLAGRFGMTFNEVSISNFEGNQNRHLASFVNLPHHPIFYNVEKIYMRGISTIAVDKPQYVLVKKDEQPAMSFKRYGKGAVFMVGDPWLYNEYIEHRVLSKDYENHIAADNLVSWILGLVKVIRN